MLPLLSNKISFRLDYRSTGQLTKWIGKSDSSANFAIMVKLFYLQFLTRLLVPGGGRAGWRRCRRTYYWNQRKYMEGRWWCRMSHDAIHSSHLAIGFKVWKGGGSSFWFQCKSIQVQDRDVQFKLLTFSLPFLFKINELMRVYWKIILPWKLAMSLKTP